MIPIEGPLKDGAATIITITNEKVAGFDPRWAPFRGFTLLFDNPGASLIASGPLSYMNCDLENDADLLLFKAFRDSLEHLGTDLLTNTYLFCPLPPVSYHVTVWDGVNAGNLIHVVPEHRVAWERFLQELPWSLKASELFSEIAGSSLISHPDWNIQFRFERLEKWSNVSIVARLAPANEESANALSSLVEARVGLSAAFEQRFGVCPNLSYAAHVTLGYFANQDLAEQASWCMEQWDATFRDRTAGLTLGLPRVSLYGFTDMATFFKPTQPLSR